MFLRCLVNIFRSASTVAASVSVVTDKFMATCIYYTHINITDIVKIVHKDNTVLTPKQLGEASL